jgi:hypothetical protein
MKKLITMIILVFPTFLILSSCGGKNMDETPDGSGCGPKYYNEFEEHRSKHADADSTGHH